VLRHVLQRTADGLVGTAVYRAGEVVARAVVRDVAEGVRDFARFWRARADNHAYPVVGGIIGGCERNARALDEVERPGPLRSYGRREALTSGQRGVRREALAPKSDNVMFRASSNGPGKRQRR